MQASAAPTIVLTAWFAAAHGSAVLSGESETPLLRDGDPCNETGAYLSKTDGMRTGNQLAGTILRTTADGVLQGVHLARLYLAHPNPNDGPPSVLTSTDRKGRFILVMPLWYSDTKWCRNGVVVTERYFGGVDIVVKAKGCQDLELELGPTTTGQSWRMKCETPPSG